jgi:site-specific recombinase XerD
MSALASTLQAFFTDRLRRERHASPQTVAAYRDTWRLLLGFGAMRIGKSPSALDFEDIDVPLVCAFLDHLERDRRNSVRTRNARLAAIHSLFRYAAFRHPEHADTIARVLAILPKRFERAIVAFLTEPEVEALLATPNPTSWTGRRDHALLLVAVQTGLRISELIGLRRSDVHLGVGAHLICHGKGRKERITPLTIPVATVLRAWLAESNDETTVSVFPTRTGKPLSRDAIEHRIALHATAGAIACPTLAKKHVTAHVLRHTAAMRLLEAGIDPTVIALWLGHERLDTTAIYLHAHLGIKEKALARVRMLPIKPGRYRPSDALLTFLESL